MKRKTKKDDKWVVLWIRLTKEDFKKFAIIQGLLGVKTQAETIRRLMELYCMHQGINIDQILQMGVRNENK